ncbi:hypothetical protein ACQPYE_39870 [Actinosynnema sp. CA-299493]
MDIDDYPVKVELVRPEGDELGQVMTVLGRVCSRGDGYVLSVRSRRVFRVVGPDAMRPVSAWETAAIHRLGNMGLIFLVPEESILRSGAVRARVNLLLPSEVGFDVMQAWWSLKQSG